MFNTNPTDVSGLRLRIMIASKKTWLFVTKTGVHRRRSGANTKLDLIAHKGVQLLKLLIAKGCYLFGPSSVVSIHGLLVRPLDSLHGYR